MRNRTLMAAGVLGLPMLAAGAAGLGVMSSASASERVVAQAEATMPKLVVVKFHADWCGKCEQMAEPLAEARRGLIEEPVLFVTYDFTDEVTARQAEYLASVLEQNEIWAEHERRTGFVLLVEPLTNAVLAAFTPDNIDELEDRVRGAL